jgi:glycosyltransferase involved in cell wall biosynthesis
MADKPLVSVMMNCYNCSKYLREAINSVYSQEYKNWEIIFWDNASTDASGEIALSYNSKVKYYRADRNTNLGQARVLAVKKSTGDYLAFLDCDDLWLKDKLKLQMDIFNKNNDIGIVYGKVRRFIKNNKQNILPNYFDESTKLPEGRIFDKLTKGGFIPFVSAVIPKYIYEECGGFPSNYKSATDYSLFLKITYKYKVRAIQNVCCMYRVHDDNLSNKIDIVGIQEGIEAIKYFLPDKRAKVGLRYRYTDLAILYLKKRRFLFFLSVVFSQHLYMRIFKRFVKKMILVKNNHE